MLIYLPVYSPRLVSYFNKQLELAGSSYRLVLEQVFYKNSSRYVASLFTTMHVVVLIPQQTFACLDEHTDKVTLFSHDAGVYIANQL